MDAERCVMCGDIIPEGIQVCPTCDRKIRIQSAEYECKAAAAKALQVNGQKYKDDGGLFMFFVPLVIALCLLCVMLSACGTGVSGYTFHTEMGDGLDYSGIVTANLYEVGEAGAYDIDVEGETPVDTDLTSEEAQELAYVISWSDYEKSEYMPDRDYIYMFTGYDTEGSTVCDIFAYTDSVWLADWMEGTYYILSGDDLDAFLGYVVDEYGIEIFSDV